jgi:hypothetical protein
MLKKFIPLVKECCNNTPNNATKKKKTKKKQQPTVAYMIKITIFFMCYLLYINAYKTHKKIACPLFTIVNEANTQFSIRFTTEVFCKLHFCLFVCSLNI